MPIKDGIEAMINVYKNKSIILIDSNLLLLLLIGEYDPKIISKCPRTENFEEEDYYTLVDFLKPFNKILTAPNVLTEVSNLLGISVEGRWKEEVFSKFKEKISTLSEDFCPSIEGAGCEDFPKIGLTDAVILKISKKLSREKLLVITEDFTLAGILQRNNIDVVNFNHIRTYNWKF